MTRYISKFFYRGLTAGQAGTDNEHATSHNKMLLAKVLLAVGVVLEQCFMYALQGDHP